MYEEARSGCSSLLLPERIHQYTFFIPSPPSPRKVGKHCKDGVCTMMVNNGAMSCEFQNLGVQCVKKQNVVSSLEEREALYIDPFSHGFAHKEKAKNIDLNSIRLCFQVALFYISFYVFLQVHSA